MTGWSRRGKAAHQREKIYALIRVDAATVFQIVGQCWESKDPAINTIRAPAVRRCLQELRDHFPTLAHKDELSGKWTGFQVEQIEA